METLYKTMYATLAGQVDKALESIAEMLLHNQCDWEHVNKIGENLKAALLEAEDLYLDAGEK